MRHGDQVAVVTGRSDLLVAYCDQLGSLEMPAGVALRAVRVRANQPGSSFKTVVLTVEGEGVPQGGECVAVYHRGVFREFVRIPT